MLEIYWPGMTEQDSPDVRASTKRVHIRFEHHPKADTHVTSRNAPGSPLFPFSVAASFSTSKRTNIMQDSLRIQEPPIDTARYRHR